MAMAFLSSPPTPTLSPASSSNSISHLKPHLLPPFNSRPKRSLFLSHSVSDNGAGVATSPPPPPPPAADTVTVPESAPPAEDLGSFDSNVKRFDDSRWVNGTWDLKQFTKNGATDWDSVIDAEARRRKWLENSPEPSSNDEPVLFDTSIIPWWAWIKKFHLPEAELLNGRAAMVGFFMAYFVDSLTGVGLVDQMGNFFCKTLLFVAVSGVLLVRKNEDIETLKKLFEETTFYDRQWQATWKEDSTEGSKKD
ncbi:hypothetical protein V2J09_009950 [Rumex salicifolius]